MRIFGLKDALRGRWRKLQNGELWRDGSFLRNVDNNPQGVVNKNTIFHIYTLRMEAIIFLQIFVTV